jgi:hypothetical protein
LGANIQQHNLIGLLILGQLHNPTGENCCLYGSYSSPKQA